jgi:uncharacterized membrane protein
MTQVTAGGEGTLSMGGLSITLEPDEEQGLRAVAELAAARRGSEADLADEAQSLLHQAIAVRLEELGLNWAPSPEAVAVRVSEAARPAGRLTAFLRTDRVRRAAGSALAVAVLVVLWGGYAQHWQWTGFPENEQLWDWLHLLLLPVVVGTVPLWLRHSDYVSPVRRRLYALGAVAFAGFAVAGYLVPLAWTGFPGNTLWNWLGLLLLPAAIASARFLPSMLRRLRPAHQLGAVVLVLAWTLTVVGGYAWRWTWTGYEGNTLWDWLQLLLLPFVVPVFLLPAAVGWMSDNAPSGGTPPRVKAAAR